MKSISFPIKLNRYNRRKDKAVTFGVESRYEISSNDITEIDGSLDCLGVLILTDRWEGDITDKEIQDIISEMPKYDTQEVKSPSKRLRAVLYVLQEQELNRKPTTEEFARYYSDKMESIINKIKEKLND